MQKIILQKGTVIIVALLICCLATIPMIISLGKVQATTLIKKNYLTFNPNSNTLYVGGIGPGNYTRIQDAIDDSSNGDIIFVYQGDYYENINVYKSINLIGENREYTIIYGDGKASVINFTTDWVYLNGFSIGHSGENRYDAAITLFSSNNVICNNIISNNQNGLYLENAGNNLVSNNIISENYNGIFLNSSKNNTIRNNIITKNKDGINLISNSDSSYIIENNISENEYDGIYIKSSSNNTILKNKFSNNYRGLWLHDETNNNIIQDNVFLNDGLVIQNSFENTISNNSVNDEPILYLENKSNLILNEDTGQIILVNCNNITIKNQTISNVYLGIELLKTNSCLISENIISNNVNGLNLHYSNNNRISKNTFNSNNWNSIYLSKSKNNIIIDNQIISTDEFSGIDLWDYSNNTIISRNNFSNNAYGIHVYNTSHTLITKNNFLNDHYGVCLWFLCTNTTIFSNNFEKCRDGIWSYYARNNNISENKIKDSKYDGIWLYNSSNNKISKNLIFNCTCGIEIANSKSNTIIENTLEKGGFFVYYSFENTVSNNIVNGKPLEYLENESDISIYEAGQVILIKCDNISIQDQGLIDTIIGIQLWWADNCYISGNTVSNNFHGSWVIFSNNNTLSYNNISNNQKWGVYLFSSNDNTFLENKIQNANTDYKNEVIFTEDKKILNLLSINRDFKSNYLNFKTGISKSTNRHYLWEKNDLNNLENIASSNLCGMTIVASNRNDISGNTIDSNTDHGILLSYSNKNSISENNVRLNTDGIIIENSNSNTIDNNLIDLNNDYGLHFIDSNGNTISANTISNNHRGVFHSNSSENTVLRNNFIKNEQNAYFKNCKNKWKSNYWERPRLFPKLILGKIKIGLKEITWFNVDWRPALKHN